MSTFDDEQLNEHQKLTREIYARYGLAMYWAQCVERELASALSTTFGPEPVGMSVTAYEAQMDERFERTLGQLVKELERKSPEQPLLTTRQLRDGLELRNFLAHNFFWERAGQMSSKNSALREPLLDELDRASAALKTLNDALTALSADWRRRHGVTEEWIAAEMKKI